MSQTIRWTIGIAIVAVAVIFGLTCLMLVRYGSLDARPWQTIGLGVGATGGLGGFILCIVESAEVSMHDEPVVEDAAPVKAHAKIGA